MREERWKDGTPVAMTWRQRLSNRPTDERDSGRHVGRMLAFVLTLVIAACGGFYHFTLKPEVSSAAGYREAASAPKDGKAPNPSATASPSGKAPSSAPNAPAQPQAGQIPPSGPKACTSSRGGGCYNWQPVNGTCWWSTATQPENIRIAWELFGTPHLKLDQRTARIKFPGTKPGPEPGTILLGFAPEHWNAYCKLAMTESGFRKDARGPHVAILEGGRPRGRACGIPQALPCEKMGPGNRDGYTELTAWEQLVWQFAYIHARPQYGNPSAAWEHAVKNHWY